MIDWKPFLEGWSAEWLSHELAEKTNPPTDSKQWLGFPPATESDIEELESRLGVLLPPSYASFLRITNGWRSLDDYNPRLLPASEVDWFRVENEGWIEVYCEPSPYGLLPDPPDEEYYRYGKDRCEHCRNEHFRSTLLISTVGDGSVILLNPEAVTADGEWEAWDFANHNPGAVRYPSFAHLMYEDYLSFRSLAHIPGSIPVCPSPPIPAPSAPRVPAERIPGRMARAPDFADLVPLLRSADERSRGRAVRIFRGKLLGRGMGRRRPDLVGLLTDLFYHSKDPWVRMACISGLIEFVDDSASPTVFLDALSDPDKDVVLAGAYALYDFPDHRAVEPLCQFVASNSDVGYLDWAMSHLGDLGDPRAIPVLLDALLHRGFVSIIVCTRAACSLVRCGPEGIRHVIAALKHPDSHVRRAAVSGLHDVGDPELDVHLRPLVNDPDEGVASHTRFVVERLANRRRDL